MVNWFNSPPFFLIKKESKNQGSQKNINPIFAQPKFGRVISEASSELPDLSKVELQSERNFFECPRKLRCNLWFGRPYLFGRLMSGFPGCFLEKVHFKCLLSWKLHRYFHQQHSAIGVRFYGKRCGVPHTKAIALAEFLSVNFYVAVQHKSINAITGFV